MKRVLFVLIAIVGIIDQVHAWQAIGEMEADVCIALTNKPFLTSSVFTNNLKSAASSLSVEMKTEANLLLAIVAYQNFLDTADAEWLRQEMTSASNAVVSVGTNRNLWLYWMARFVYAGAYVSEQANGKAYLILTNALDEFSSYGYTNKAVSVERAMLDKFEMSNLGVGDAMKVMAGMAAGELGMKDVATNYANEVSQPYRTIILEFLR